MKITVEVYTCIFNLYEQMNEGYEGNLQPVLILHVYILNSLIIECPSESKNQDSYFYALGRKGPQGHLVIGLSVCLSICPSVRS